MSQPWPPVEASVWAINEWDPNSWAPPGDQPWEPISTGEWRDPATGSTVTHVPEWGNGSGRFSIAA